MVFLLYSTIDSTVQMIHYHGLILGPNESETLRISIFLIRLFEFYTIFCSYDSNNLFSEYKILQNRIKIIL